MKNLISELDLKAVKSKLKSRKGVWWNLWNDIDKLEKEYRQFLHLIDTAPEHSPVVPWSQALDDFWHEHILDTKKYEADCLRIFGRMIHHNPHLAKGTAAHTKAAKKTKIRRSEEQVRATANSSSSDDGGFALWNLFSAGDGGGSSESHASSCGSSCSSGCGSSCGSGCGGGD